MVYTWATVARERLCFKRRIYNLIKIGGAAPFMYGYVNPNVL